MDKIFPTNIRGWEYFLEIKEEVEVHTRNKGYKESLKIFLLFYIHVEKL